MNKHSPSDLQQLLINVCASLQSKRISVELNADKKGIVYVHNGRILEALIDKTSGINALTILLNEHHIQLDQLSWEDPPSKTINLPVIRVLSQVRKHRVTKPDVKVTAKNGKPSSLTGTLTQYPLKELLAKLCQEPSPCKIHIQMKAGISGTIHLENHHVQDASLGKLRGLKALALLLDQQQGDFLIQKGLKISNPSIDLPYDQACQNASLELDRAGGIPHSKPSSITALRKGDLETTSLASLLNQFCQTPESVCIYIDTGSGMIGQIFLEDHHVKEAMLDEVSSIPALALLIEHAKGQFYVGYEEIAKASIMLPPQEAMEAAQTLL